MAGKETGALVRREFGALVRRGRESRRIKLRHMAKSIGVSPAYLSKIELGDFDPPAEDKVRKIAEIIGYNPDVLLALAGRVGSDLAQIIRQRPGQMADLLRAAERLTGKQMAGLVQQAQQQAKRQKAREQRAKRQKAREQKAREQKAREQKAREQKARKQREQRGADP
jgi:transcriptional regulator with XRE-family HTH domain